MIELLLAVVILGLLPGTPLALLALYRLHVLRARLERQEAALRLHCGESSSAPSRAGGSTPTAPPAAPPAVPASPAPPAGVHPTPVARVEGPATRPVPLELPGLRPPRAPSRRTRVSWEQWIGVRGMAVVGSLGLALAGLLFYQYSVERGWVTPLLRVSLGGLAGLATWGLAFRLRPRGYSVTADCLTGAAAVLLYGALWSAHTLYSLLPPLPALVGMALVTVASGASAVRHASRTIAVFTLAGGFATPLLLNVGQEQPIALFGYLLVLDLGLLGIARRSRWPLLQVLAMAATCLIYLARLALGFEPGEQLLGLALFGALSVVFAADLQSRPDEAPGWRAARGFLAVLMPLPAALHFAQVATLPGHAFAIAFCLALALALAEWVDRRLDAPGLPLAAASGGAAVLGVWTLQSVEPGPLPWTAFALSTALGLASWLAVELRARAGLRVGAAQAGSVAAGLLGHAAGALAAASLHGATPAWLYLALLLPGTLALWRTAAHTGRGELRFGSALLPALGWWLFTLGATVDPAHLPAPAGRCAIGLALAAGFAVAALRAPGNRRPSALGAALLVTVASTLALAPRHGWGDAAPLLVLITTLPLALLGLVTAAALSESGRRGGARVAGAVLATALAVFPVQWTASGPALAGGHGLAVALAGLAAVLAFTQVPLTLRARFERSPLAWLVVLPLPLLAYPQVAAGLARSGLPLERLASTLAMALVCGLAAWRARSWRAAEPASPSARRLLLAFGIGATAFAGLALPLEVDRHVALVAAALLALGASLWTRLRAPEVRLVEALLTLLAAGVGAGLTFEALQLALGRESIGRSGIPLVHWGSYTWGLPALALLAASRLAGLVGPGPRPASQRLARAALALVGITALFATANLALVDLFSSGPTLDFGPVGAGRDLALSLTWAAFAGSLLAVGVLWRQQAPRWMSLAFFLATIVKVFLYDLGELRGLFRVGSLLGLAVSLIAVSLCYQRFVFPRGRENGPDTGQEPRAGGPREAQA